MTHIDDIWNAEPEDPLTIFFWKVVLGRVFLYFTFVYFPCLVISTWIGFKLWKMGMI